LNVAQERLHKLTDIIPQTRILNCHRTVVLELWICPSFRSLAETGSKPSPDLATKLLPFSPLIAQKTLLVDLDGLQVSTWVAPIVQPVLNQLQVVAHTATVDPHPVDAFNPITLQPILFQG
jgi:hypothetical protein